MMNERVLLALQLIAAKSAKLAYDYQHGKLWPGQLNEGAAEIAEALRDVTERP